MENGGRTVKLHVDQIPEQEFCGYCGDPMFWGDEHDDMEVCSRCLVKVPDEELEEMGLL